MLQNNLQVYSIKDLGFNNVLTKQQLFDPTDELYTPFYTTLDFGMSTVTADKVKSGSYTGDYVMSLGYLQSSNYVAGVNGWKFDYVGNLEANTAVIRGSIYAASGNIGGWIIDDSGMYYNGSGDPYIKTSINVGAGYNGVILDKDGIRGYDDVLGVVFNLYSNGTAPYFAFGQISESIFEVNTNAVIRTSSTVGDGSASSYGILLNNSGFYAYGPNQSAGNSNVRILTNGDAYFSGTISASNMTGSEINGGTIDGAIITGGMIRTSDTGQRTEITSEGIILQTGAESGGSQYYTVQYFHKSGGTGDHTIYGTGVLAYINNSNIKVPFYINAEQTVADMHMYNRTGNPTGASEIGDLCVVDNELKICTGSGTPGTWNRVGVSVGTTAPDDPATGDLWVDTT